MTRSKVMKVLKTAKSAFLDSKMLIYGFFGAIFRIFWSLAKYFLSFVSILQRVLGSRKAMPLSVFVYLYSFWKSKKCIHRIKRDLIYHFFRNGQVVDFSVKIRQKTLFLSLIVAKVICKVDFKKGVPDLWDGLFKWLRARRCCASLVAFNALFTQKSALNQP